MTKTQDPQPEIGNVHQIVPHTSAANPDESSFENAAIAADELNNLIYVLFMLFSENTTHSQEQRAAITITGAMQTHMDTLNQHFTQKQ